MGYDLHITRKEFWVDEEGPEISFKEWSNYIAKDKEIDKDPENGDYDFLYMRHPVEPVPLWWERGEIYTKNPDKYTLKKLIEIAQQIEARVMGDDDETYSDWTRFPNPDLPLNEPKSKGLFSRIFGK